MKIQNNLSAKDFNMIKFEISKLNQDILKNFNLINTSSNVVGPILNSFAECLNENNITYKSVLEYENFSFLEINEQSEYSMVAEPPNP